MCYCVFSFLKHSIFNKKGVLSALLKTKFMKKIITLMIALFAIKSAVAQHQPEEPTLLHFRLEGTNFDNRKVVGFTHFTSRTTVADLRINMDGRNTFSLSMGPVLSRHHHDQIRISIMPGLSYNPHSKLSYSGALFFRAEEIRGIETYFYVKGMKSFSGEETKWLAEGDLLLSIGHSFRIGPSVSVETEKFMKHSPEETITYGGILNLGPRFSWTPKKESKLAISGFLGWENKAEDEKNRFAFIKAKSENNFIFEIGLEFSF